MSIQEEKLAAIADAIREKEGSTGTIPANDFPARIRAIETGVDTSDATAVASDIASGKTAYVGGEKVTGVVTEYLPGSDFYLNTGSAYDSRVTDKFEVAAPAPASPLIIRPGTEVYVRAPLSDLGTAVASKVASGQTFSSAEGLKITGTMPVKTSTDLTASGSTISVPAGFYASDASKSVATATQATPSITVSSSGLITAKSTQSAGYVSSGTKSATKQLTTQSGKTVTPGTSTQTAVSSGRYTTGAVYVAGSSNLVASNIKSGVTIFNVTGTMSSADNIKLSSIGDATITSGTSSTFYLRAPVSNVNKVLGLFFQFRSNNSETSGTEYTTFILYYSPQGEVLKGKAISNSFTANGTGNMRSTSTSSYVEISLRASFTTSFITFSNFDRIGDAYYVGDLNFGILYL